MHNSNQARLPIEQVLFDLGGVLIDWDPRFFFSKIIPDINELNYFIDNICTRAWNEEQDRGRLWSVAVSELSVRFPHYSHLIRMYHERWQEMLLGEISGTVQILRCLKDKQVDLYALTNWSAETFPIARARFEFLQWFKGIVVSGEEFLIKPDLRIFNVVSSRYGLDPEKTLFIDDVEKNILAAASLGFKTIRFLSPEQLKSDFSKFEVRGLHIETLV